MIPIQQPQKIKARVWIIFGPQNTFIEYETNAAAEAQWKVIVGAIRDKKFEFLHITHDKGAMCIKVDVIDGTCWTIERRPNEIVPAGMHLS